ncbi:MAG: HU family DNA-binding protein [Bacteroidales bacterium]|nr:HU family DNA-binding protein [Bacteroides sp.]MCM1502978.1 HU family DNA-binding protein [Bacteroidales bacterium]
MNKEELIRTLDSGEPVKWTGFGSFVVKDIPPRSFYLPKRKEYVTSSGVKRIVLVESGKRKYKGATYTIGDLFVDGRFFCHTIEDAVHSLPVCNTPRFRKIASATS